MGDFAHEIGHTQKSVGLKKTTKNGKKVLFRVVVSFHSRESNPGLSGSSELYEILESGVCSVIC